MRAGEPEPRGPRSDAVGGCLLLGVGVGLAVGIGVALVVLLVGLAWRVVS